MKPINYLLKPMCYVLAAVICIMMFFSGSQIVSAQELKSSSQVTAVISEEKEVYADVFIATDTDDEMSTLTKTPDIALSGWEKIVEYLKSNDEISQLTIYLKGNTVVPKEVWILLEKRAIVLRLVVDEFITWEIKGTDIGAGKKQDLDMGAVLGLDTVSEKTITDMLKELYGDNVSGMVSYTQIHLNHDGEYGFSGKLVVTAGTKYRGHDTKLYYYNPEQKILESPKINEVSEKGITDFTLTHASDYVMYVLEKTNETKMSTLVKTYRKKMNITLVILAGIFLSLEIVKKAGIGTWLVRRKARVDIQNEQEKDKV